jgi:hypothetical protein
MDPIQTSQLEIDSTPHKLKKKDYSLLQLMQYNDKYYNKIRKINKQELSHNSKNARQSEINSHLFSIYDFIDEEFNNFKSNKHVIQSCFKHKLTKIEDHNNKVLQKALFSSLYIPSNIIKYIQDKSKYIIEYNCDIGNGRNVKINFIIFENSTYELNNIRKKGASYFKNCALKIYLWLKLLAKYSDVKCGTKLECFIYLTPFKRILPNVDLSKNEEKHNVEDTEEYKDYEDYIDEYNHNNILKPIHVNGGVSDVCQTSGRIVVYRKEEWFKVFVHETMHNYGLDFSTLNITNANIRLQKIFTIHKDVKIYESYCEVWARIVNIIFESYFEINAYKKFSSRTTRKNFIEKLHQVHTTHNRSTKVSHNKYDKFLNCFYDYLQHESIFSLFQCIKILNYMGLDYNIISNCTDVNYITVKKLYKEETNVFAYYIIVSILLNNFNSFMLWCIDNNTNLFHFKKTEKNIDSFINFIYNNYKTNNILKLVVAIENKLEMQKQHNNSLLSTMRMTVIGGTL